LSLLGAIISEKHRYAINTVIIFDRHFGLCHPEKYSNPSQENGTFFN
jgi:hypothetical protein